MNIKNLITLAAFTCLFFSCAKEELMTANQAEVASPSMVVPQEPQEEPTNPPPKPKSGEEEGDPFEVG